MFKQREPTVQISAVLPVDLYSQLTEIGEKNSVTRAEVIRTMLKVGIDEYRKLEKEKNQTSKQSNSDNP